MENEDSGPKHLDKLLSHLKGMAQSVRTSRRRAVAKNHSGSVKLPRALCDLCGKPWDFALLTNGGLPEVRRCSECKTELAKGWTALVRKQEVADSDWLLLWVRGGNWKPGSVFFNLPDEFMQKVKAKLNAKSNDEPDHPPMA